MYEPILYLCDRTSYNDFNSGIQRVVRGLGKSLLNLGVPLVPVALNNDYFELLEPMDLEVLSHFSGPSVASWGTRPFQVEQFKKARTILIPELTPAYPKERSAKEITALAKEGGLNVAFLFYDAIPWLFSQWYESELYFNNALGILDADVVFPVSYSAYSDLLTTVAAASKKPVNKVVPVSLPTEPLAGVKEVYKAPSNGPVRLLSVSSIEFRKNHKGLLEAIKLAKPKLDSLGIKLQSTFVAAGINPYVMKEMNALIDELNVVILQGCSDEELHHQYELADFTVYPSLYEGFGLPLVESFSFNTPVITSTGGSLGEVAAAGGCLTFDPKNIEELAAHIVTLASKKVVRDELIEQIKARPIKTWKTYAKEIISVLQPN